MDLQNVFGKFQHVINLPIKITGYGKKLVVSSKMWFCLDICNNVLITLMSEYRCGTLQHPMDVQARSQMDFAGNIWVPSIFCNSPGVKHHLTQTRSVRGIKVTETKAQKEDQNPRTTQVIFISVCDDSQGSGGNKSKLEHLPYTANLWLLLLVCGLGRSLLLILMMQINQRSVRGSPFLKVFVKNAFLCCFALLSGT